MLSGLPQGWVECILGDVLYLQNGYAFNSKDYSSEGVSIVRISDIQNGRVLLDKSVKYNKSLVDECFEVKKGDFLIAMSGATTGKTGVYIENEIAYLNQRVGNLKIYCKDVLFHKYRDFFISNKRREIEKRAYGGAQPNISKHMIEDIDLFLPPLNEQRRIVEKIEREFAKIDEGLEHLENAKEQIKQYRQSVLKSAFEGKLYKTSEWLNTVFENIIDVNPKTDIPTIDLKKLVSFLPMPSVYAETNKYNEELIQYEKVKKGYTKFQNQDVLFAKITPCMENGKTCIVNNLQFGVGFGSTEFHVLRSLGKILPEFIFYFMVQKSFRKQAQNVMTGAVGQRRVPADYLKNIKINLPTLEEQKRIVEEIEKRFAVADEVEKVVEDNIEKAKQLKQSILKKAFEGRLVPQDPNDEPASILLKKIKQERSKK